MERDCIKAISNVSIMDCLKYAILCARLYICFFVGIMSGYQSISLLELWPDFKHILQYLWKTRNYMFVSLCDEVVLLSYQEIGLQFDKDSYKSISGYVYTLSGFLLFLQQQRKPFDLLVVPLAISSKILLCDNSRTMTWSKELKYHQKRKHINKKCYLIVRQYREVMRHETIFSMMPSLILGLVGVFQD